MTLERSLPLEALLAEADHVTALARALVADPATADDVAQATWMDVLRARRHSIVDPRAWLATIVRRRAMRARRSESRRSHHERAAVAARADEAAPSAAELAARVLTHRELVDAVLALDEPYRETIVLRFFEHLDADAIAERMQTKRNTVRSRLQRGLDALRERLDRTRGGRENWLPAVSALGGRHMALETAAASTWTTGGIAIAFTMKKLALAVTALVVAVLFALPMVAPPAESTPPRTADRTTVAVSAPIAPVTTDPTTNVDAAGDRASGAANPRAPVVAAAPPEPAPIRRRLVDRETKPLEGVVVRASAPTTVRWQGGDRGWIGGAGHTIRVRADEEQRLLTDTRYASEFFAELPTPEEWRAVILGTPLPPRDVRTDRDGWFTFPKTLAVDDDAVEIADPRFVLITAGEGSTKPWVAGPAVRVEGSVHDDGGKAIPDAFVLAMVPTEKAPIALHAQLETRTDDDGAFLVRRGLANGVLRVACDGYEPALVPLNEQAVQQPYIVLHRPGFTSMRTITGTVTAVGGAPIANASVWFGRQQTKTAADGRFAIAADLAKPQYALTIVAKGWAALQENGFGKKVLAGGRTQDLLFVLEKKPKRIGGHVRTRDGAPVEGALVFLVDPTLLDVSFDTVESRVANAPAAVSTDAQGAFALDGLDDRRYQVRAVDPATAVSVTSPPHSPGTGDLDLRLPGIATRIRGRVVDADRKPLRNATIEIAFFTHVTKGGGTQMQSTPAVPCDPDGAFNLFGCQDDDAWFCVRVDGKVRQVMPTLLLLGQAEGELVCDGSRWLRLLLGPSRGIGVAHFQRRDGSLVDASGLRIVSCVTEIPKDAVAVILDKETPEMQRLELTDDFAVHLRAR